MTRRPQTSNIIEPQPRAEVVRVLLEDRDAWAWEYAHLARALLAETDADRGRDPFALYLRAAMTAIRRGDPRALDEALEQLQKLATRHDD